MNYYDAKFARERKANPIDWVIAGCGERITLIRIGVTSNDSINSEVSDGRNSVGGGVRPDLQRGDDRLGGDHST